MIKNRKNKRNMVMLLAGTMALTGFAAEMPISVLSENVSVVSAAGAMVYDTQNGIATMGTGTGQITISGNSGQPLQGKQFSVYKLFYAENSRDGESINYTFNPTYEQALKNVVAQALSKGGTQISAGQVTEYMVLDYIQSLNTNPVEGTQAEQTLEGSYSSFRYFVESIRDEIVKQQVPQEIVRVKDVRGDNTVLLSGLEYGYYVVDEVSAVEETHSASSLCMVDTINPTSEISIKSDYPSVTKKIQEDDANADITDADRWNDIGDYEIGQTVPYRYDSNIPNMNGYHTYYYAWHDKMDDALTFHPDSVVITITGKDKSGKDKTYTLAKAEYTITTPGTGNETFHIAVSDIKAIVDREFDQKNNLGENVYGQSVLLTYNATLNENAAKETGRPGFENDVRLEFSNDADSDHSGSTGYTPWDTVVCFTYKLNVEKLNDHQKTLSGAKFRLYSDEKCENEVYVKEGNGGYIVINRDQVGGKDHTGGSVPGEAVEMVSSEEGVFTIFGLDGGTYYLKETDAPDGYRVLKTPITLTVTPTFTTSRDTYVKGSGATEEVLQKLEAAAHIESFYDGLVGTEDQTLETDVAEGSMNMTVINKVGKNLPVTGTSAVIIMFTAGTALMTGAIVKSRKKKRKVERIVNEKKVGYKSSIHIRVSALLFPSFK